MGCRLLLSYALLVLSLCACGASDSPGSVDPSTEPLPASVAPEAGDRVDTRRSDHEPPAQSITAQQPAAQSPATFATMTLLRLGAGSAEDGAGNVVHAEERVALDLDAQVFPPRALDPVLSVGARRFVHYSHPRPGVLRFVADASRLTLGAEVSIQYGDEVSSRRLLRQALTDADLQVLQP